MLPERPWKLEALIRLAVSVFLCFCAGYIVSVALPAISAGKASLRLFAVDGLGLACLAAAMVLVRRSWAEGNAARRLLLVLVCAYSGMLLGFWGQHLAGTSKASVSTGQMLTALASFQGALLVFVPGFVREHELGLTDAFGLTQRWQVALAAGVFAACIFFPLGLMIQQIMGWLMENLPYFHVQPTPQQAVQTIRSANTWFDRITLAAATIIIVPISEEVLFRGILYTWIRNLGFKKLALVGTSLAFAIVHFYVQGLPALFLLAIILGVLYERTGNLVAPIVAHSVFNTLNLIVLYGFQNELQQQPY
jgi:membrane protease YdiL (CAAX protease family)